MTSGPARGEPAPSGLERFVDRGSAGDTGALDVLRRFTAPRPRRRAGEACEMCGDTIPEHHSHVVNLESRSLLCTCRGCYLLFTPEGAAAGKYRAVPDRHMYDPNFELSAGQWEAIQIPVRMAFFFFNSGLGSFVAFYPSPGGATESLLDIGAWEDVLRANPDFAGVAPDVEALLLHKVDDRFECYLMPIDASYELVGRVRLHWRGFDGGAKLWQDIDAFLEALRRRSHTVARGEGHE